MTPGHFLLWWYHQQGITHTLVMQNATHPLPALTALWEEMKHFEGCALRKTAQHTVFADGNPQSPIMFVGEAPGAEEDRLGKPFVGMSGQLLDQMLRSIHLDRTKVYITNIVPWRPPFNRQPSQDEITACLPFIQRHIALIQPKILVCVGAVAYRALFGGKESMASLQGKCLSYSSPLLAHPLPTFSLYHPAYLLRSPSQKKAAFRQLLLISEALAQGTS